MTTQHELLDVAIKRVGNRYIATMMVAQRIRQLNHGARPYVRQEEDESHFNLAMREIAEGYVVMDSPFTADSVTSGTPLPVENGTPPAAAPLPSEEAASPLEASEDTVQA